MSSAPANEDGVTQWRRIAIGGGAAMFVGIAMGRFSYTTMLPPLIQSGQLSELEAGYVGGLNLAAFFVGAFYAERLRNTFSIRRVLTAAVWLGLLALAASALPFGFYWLAAWRALLGAIAGLIMVQSIAFSTAAAPADKRPVAAGYVYAGVGLGVFLSGLFAPWMLKHGIVWAWSGFALAGLFAVLVAQWGWAVADILPKSDNKTPQSYHALALARPGCRQLPFFLRNRAAHYLLGRFPCTGSRARHGGPRLALERRRIVGISRSTRHSSNCRAHRHFTDAADLLYVARVWGHRPGVSRSGAGIMVLVRLLWRPARPRVHYGGACPGNGVRRGYAAHDASDDSRKRLRCGRGRLSISLFIRSQRLWEFVLIGRRCDVLGCHRDPAAPSAACGEPH